MFKGVGIFFLMILSAGFGWLINDIQRATTYVVNIPQETSSSPIKPNILKEKSSSKTPTLVQKKSIQSQIQSLLSKDLFYDVLSLYLDKRGGEKERKTIEKYLSNLVKIKPLKAIEFMEVFRDDEPSNRLFEPLIEAYISQENFKKALDLIMLEKDNYKSEKRDKKLSKKLKEVTQKYLISLKEEDNYIDIKLLLEEMINYSQNSFYNQDEFYTQKLIDMQREEKNIKDKERYEYQIPLIKKGEHFIAKVWIEGQELNLLLDTGASYIFVDEDKLPNIETIGKDIRLHTANGEIVAKIHKFSLSIADLELEDIEVTVAPFKQDGIDGLLGMNFFKKFHFNINQDEEILYLRWK
ncbi:MAG: retropepsin-like aspartic protease [Sulfurovum sp.]